MSSVPNGIHVEQAAELPPCHQAPVAENASCCADECHCVVDHYTAVAAIAWLTVSSAFHAAIPTAGKPTLLSITPFRPPSYSL